MAKKNTAQIMYNRLYNHPDFQALDPRPTIHWDYAKRWTPNPVIVMSLIWGSTLDTGVRIESYQFSIWCDTKLEIIGIKNVLVEIFNRWKSEDIEYCKLDHNVAMYDSDSNSHWEHLGFKIKLFDPEY